LLGEGDEFDPLSLEGFQRSEEVRYGSRKPVESSDHDRVKPPPVRISHQPIQLRPLPFVPEMPMSTCSPATVHPRRSRYSRSSRVCIVGSWPLIVKSGKGLADEAPTHVHLKIVAVNSRNLVFQGSIAQGQRDTYCGKFMRRINA
jgi:hypothetical protein